MDTRQVKRSLLSAALTLCCVAAPVVASADDEAEPREVPEALLPYLSAAEKSLAANKPKEALAYLLKYDGEDDALRQLLIGHARYALRDYRRSEGAYKKALDLDGALKPAALGLARSYVERQVWPAAAEVLGKHVDVGADPAPYVGLYARVAYEMGDHRLATVLIERGIVRFPSDQIFRRLDVALQIERRDWPRAYEGAMDLLRKSPNDGTAWRQLAAASQRDGRDGVDELATLEAATIANPKDEALLRQHLFAQYAAGHFDHALTSVGRLIKNADVRTLELAVRIADAAGETKRGREWLARIAAKDRSRTVELLDARLSARDGDPAQAQQALERLIQRGDADTRVLLWAGQIAESAGDLAKAEARFSQARDVGGPDVGVATMHLARLYHRLEQSDRALELLATYLAAYPGDTAARRLLGALRTR